MKREVHFEGPEVDAEGKRHSISRTTCGICETVLREHHNYCCGYAQNGFYLTNHEHEVD